MVHAAVRAGGSIKMADTDHAPALTWRPVSANGRHFRLPPAINRS